jgi:hypothetical protein
MFLDSTIYYLCISESNNSKHKFICEQFKSFEEAKYNYTKICLINKIKEDHVSQIVPICKYIPLSLHNYYVNKKITHSMIQVKIK